MGVRVQGVAAIILGTSVLGACVSAPTYGPIGAPKSNGMGYKDTLNTDGSYTLLVVMSSDYGAHQFWEKRATELCAGSEYSKNIFRAQRPVDNYTGYVSNGYSGGSYTESRYGAFYLEGYLRCSNRAASKDGAFVEIAEGSESGAVKAPSGSDLSN